MGEVREEGQERGIFPKVTFFYPSLKEEVSKGQQAAGSVGDGGTPAPRCWPHALCSAQLQLCTSSAV